MQSHPTTNAIILIGTLINAGWRDTKAATTTRRTECGATVESFGLELLSPYGDPFVIPLEVNQQTPGATLITKARIGTPIAIEGSIRRRVVTDRRYAVADQDTGSRRAEVRVTVECIREPRADEPHDRSIVWLEGTIIVPPRIASHRALMDMDMARTILQVRHQRSGGFGAHAFPILELMEVQITTPYAAAAYELYRAGNRVRIVGALDMNVIPQIRNEDAAAKLAQLDAEWLSIKADIVANAANAQERGQNLRVALRRYRNTRAALQEVAMLTVVVGQVELLDGTPATEAEVADIIRQSHGRMRPGPRERMTQAVVLPSVTDAVERGIPDTAITIMEAIPDVEAVLDDSRVEACPAAGTVVVEEAELETLMIEAMPNDTEAADMISEPPHAEGRPRRRREPVLTSDIPESVGM